MRIKFLAVLFSVLASATASGQIDPPLAAWSVLANDTSSAGDFYRDITKLEPVREDEKLRFIGGDEVAFGYALACRSQNDCRSVFVRPISQITRHWLTTLQTDWDGFRLAALNDPKSAKFLADSRSAMQEPDAVWAKLAKLFCQLEPRGTYEDLDGAVQHCKPRSN